MLFSVEAQDVTSLDYKVPINSSENFLSILNEPTITDIQVKVEKIKESCQITKKKHFRHFLLIDNASIKNPILKSKITTTVIDIQAKYENSLIKDLLNRNYIVKMSPFKKKTLHFKINRVVKPGPYV